MEKLSLSLLEIPESKMEQFNDKKIDSIEDLVRYTPMRYYNIEKKSILIKDIMPFDEGRTVEIVADIIELREDRYSHRVVATINDGTGRATVAWYHQPFMLKRLHVGTKYSIVGKVAFFRGHIMINAPMFISDDPRDFHAVLPRYTKIKGMADEYLRDCILKSVNILKENNTEYLTPSQLRQLNVITMDKFAKVAHFPQDIYDIKAAGKRYLTDHLFPFALQMVHRQRTRSGTSSYYITKTEETKKFIRGLPFKLTDDQRKAVITLMQELKTGNVVDALINGDVGCGKTIIAVCLAYAMMENGFQIAIMAPTNVLAEQHFSEFTKYGLNPVLLTGQTKAKEKKRILKQIASGEASVIVGTHALVEDSVDYKCLAMVVVDEEHRFGVMQREKLFDRSRNGIHKISMSATPIPRTLASAMFGQGTTMLDIKTMPAGRRPIITCLCHTQKKLYAALHRQIDEGRQCYVICPYIEDSDKDDNIMSAETCYKNLVDNMSIYKNVKVGMVTGKMKAADIDKEIKRFADNEINILVSTTIVEVGVNVPNATVMVIQNAERFGLAQLHQLRGRVGRGNKQSYCVLVTDVSNKDNERLQTMVETTDGFEIAKADMNLRGIGDVSGLEQSGFNRTMSLVMRYPKYYKKVEQLVKDANYTDEQMEELMDKINSFQYLTRANFCDVCHLIDTV